MARRVSEYKEQYNVLDNCSATVEEACSNFTIPEDVSSSLLFWFDQGMDDLKLFHQFSPQWDELQDCYKNLTNPPHLLNSTSKIKALVQGDFDKSGINHDKYNSMSSHSECVTLDSEDASAHCACWENINTSELVPRPELPIF